MILYDTKFSIKTQSMYIKLLARKDAGQYKYLFARAEEGSL